MNPSTTPISATAIPESLHVSGEIRQTPLAPPLVKSSKKPVDLKKFFLRFIQFIFITSVLGWVFFSADMSSLNLVFKNFGIAENLQQKTVALEQKEKLLENTIKDTQKNITRKEKAIATGTFIENQDIIETVRKEQKIFFDTLTDLGKVKQFGIFDIPARVQDYFNSIAYEDPNGIVQGRSDQIKITGLQVFEDRIGMKLEVSEILGRVFYLSSEVVQIINSFPSVKNGLVKDFIRKQNDFGEDSVVFEMNFEYQYPKTEVTDSKDTNTQDIRFQEYLSSQL